MRSRAGIRLIVVAVFLSAAVPVLTTRGYADNAEASAVLRNDAGRRVGTVEFEQRGGKVRVEIEAGFPTSGATLLPPGFHGFHIHAGEDCTRGTTPAFSSALGHFNPTGLTHKDHAGDMPVILVNTDGKAVGSFRSDRVDVAHENSPKYIVGRTVIVHLAADNYANIPTRYVGEPDAMTLATGDAGGRYACGEIQAED